MENIDSSPIYRYNITQTYVADPRFN